MQDELQRVSAVALAALLHDLGKFYERCKPDLADGRKREATDLREEYCPAAKDGHRTHIHAAYTRLAWDWELADALPDLRDIRFSDAADDTVANAAARHHRPITPVERIIAAADRLSSAFERQKYDEYTDTADRWEYMTARLVPIFSECHRDAPATSEDFSVCYPLKALSAMAAFPEEKRDLKADAAKEEYRVLWAEFRKGLARIPAAARRK